MLSHRSPVFYKSLVIWIEGPEGAWYFTITDRKGVELAQSSDEYTTPVEAHRKAVEWIDSHSVKVTL